MAITPQEAARRATPDPQTIKRLEERIDNELVKSIERGQGYTYLDTRIFPNTAARNTIMELYQRAGWNVSYHADQHDGDSITISKPSSISRNDDFGPYGTGVSFYER